jgi:peroxiredoxin
VATFARSNGIRYPMLADADGALVESLGLRDTSYPAGTNAYGVAQPGLIVLDRERRVTGKHFVRGYRDRPDLDRVLESLR